MSDTDLGIGIGLAILVFVVVGVVGEFVYQPIEDRVRGWWRRRTEEGR